MKKKLWIHTYQLQLLKISEPSKTVCIDTKISKLQVSVIKLISLPLFCLVNVEIEMLQALSYLLPIRCMKFLTLNGLIDKTSLKWTLPLAQKAEQGQACKQLAFELRVPKVPKQTYLGHKITVVQQGMTLRFSDQKSRQNLVVHYRTNTNPKWSHEFFTSSQTWQITIFSTTANSKI